MGGGGGSNSPRSGEGQTSDKHCALCFFVFFFKPLENVDSVFHSEPDNICKQSRLGWEGGGKKNHNAITALPIKTEINKSLTSNHSHMMTYVAVISPTREVSVLPLQILRLPGVLSCSSDDSVTFSGARVRDPTR